MAGASAVRAGQAFVEIGADPRKLFAALGKINKQIGQLGSSMSSMGTKLMGVGLAIGAPLAMASRQFASFDDAIRLTGAVSGATGEALQSLNDKARELGATTSFTAVEVATLMGELGRAGFDPTEINNMTGAVLDLARATGTDATLSAGIMAATLRQFGLGATEASRAADVLTTAANSTFNTVEGLGESLKYAGPVAKSLGMSLEDTAAILGVLGNVGIQGSEAGTALRRLSVISAGAGEELKKIFGVTNTDAAGNLKPLVQILDEINTVTASMPVAERTKRMADAFGLLGITSANVLSQSADGVSDLAEKLRNAGGTAAKTAKEMDAGLGGSMRIALSAIEGTALAIGDALSPSLQSMIDGIANVAGGLTKFVKENEALVVGFAKSAGAAVLVGGAIYGIGKALSFASGTMALVLNPIGLTIALVGGAVAALAQFSGAFAGIAEVAQQTFRGVYDAIAAGDMAGAMDILWAGLHAGWLRGSEAIMGYVDPWIAMFQNTFTYLGTTIATTWESLWSGLIQLLNTDKAIIMGVFDNLINGVMAAFDTMVAAVRKSWNWVQSFIVKGYDLAKENQKVDSEMAARARERGVSRPGIAGRTAQAAKENAQTARETQARIDAMNRGADETAQATIDRNATAAAGRREATMAAEGRLSDLTRGARDQRIYGQQAADLEKEIGNAGSLDSLRNSADEFRAMRDLGLLTSEQITRFETALDDAAERIVAGGSQGLQESSSVAVDPDAMAKAAAAASQSQSEVAGSFSAQALSGMGFGQSLAQKQLDTLKAIEQNTRVGDDGLVAA